MKNETVLQVGTSTKAPRWRSLAWFRKRREATETEVQARKGKNLKWGWREKSKSQMMQGLVKVRFYSKSTRKPLNWVLKKGSDKI